jgi:DNA polymerase-4
LLNLDERALMARTVLHFDLDAFFCAVEELLDPSLTGKAFVVGGQPGGRGVVSSASYPARKYGVRSAMPTSQAVRLCPDLIVISPRHGHYGKWSKKVMQLLRDSAPLVEQLSIDEAFMDVSDDPLGGEEVARRLQNEIQARFGLPTSWGVASNKLVAKIATEVGKPRGLVVVPPGEEAGFLATLPVGMLWGVGPKTSARLAELGVKTIGDLAALSAERLKNYFGVRGQDLATRAVGIDDRPVIEDHEARSMSAETTFSKDVKDGEELRRSLRRLSERVGARLRKAEMAGRTVRIKLRWPDFTTITRQTRLDNPTDQDGEIYQSAVTLFDNEWRVGRAVRLLGVGVADLGSPIRQLRLFDHSWEQDSRLLRALDEIKARYGRGAVQRGSRKRHYGERVTDTSNEIKDEKSDHD